MVFFKIILIVNQLKQKVDNSQKDAIIVNNKTDKG